jgi:hypothetical protein
MIIPDEKVKEVEEKFRLIYEYKQDAKNSNASANEIVAMVADLLDTEKSKASTKHWKKAVKKSFKEWLDRNMGDNSGDDASVLTAQLVMKEQE